MYCHKNKQFLHLLLNLFQFNTQIMLTIGMGICYSENFLKHFYK